MVSQPTCLVCRSKGLDTGVIASIAVACIAGICISVAGVCQAVLGTAQPQSLLVTTWMGPYLILTPCSL